MPGFFGNPPVPAHTDCRDEFVPPGGVVTIPNDFPSAVSLKVFGADPATCSATPTSALPQGLAMSGLDLSGTATVEGQVTTSFDVACADMAPKTVGPFTLRVPSATAWQPPLVFVTVSHAEFREYCNYIFNSDEAAARGPFTAVSGTNVPGWMRISSDGQACNTTGMTNSQFNSTVDGQTFVGTLSATDSKGKRSTWQVRYGGLMEPN